jgi:O-antigen ligase
MKTVSSNSWVTGQIGLIIIASFITFLLGTFILNFSILGAIIPLILLILGFFLLPNPRIFIYFVLFMVILGPAFTSYKWFSFGSAYYNVGLTGFILKGVILPVGVLYLLLRKIRIFGHELSTAAIFFIVALGIGIVSSPYKLYSFRFWMTYALGVLLYFIVLEYFKERRQTKTLFKMILLFSIPSLIVGFEHLITYKTKYRLTGLYYGSAAVLAMLCVILMLLAIFLFFEMRHKWAYVPIFTGALILLFFTYHRSSWLSFLTALFIAGCISTRHRKFLLVFLVGCLIAFVTFSQVRAGIKHRMVLDDSAIARITMSHVAWRFFKKNPIWGVGPGNFGIKSAELGATAPSGYGFEVGLAPHNEYARYLSEGGILGIAAYIFLLYSGLRLAIRVFKSSDLYVKNYGVLLISIVIVIFVSSLTDNSSLFYLTYFWIFMAIGENYLRELQAPPKHV